MFLIELVIIRVNLTLFKSPILCYFQMFCYLVKFPDKVNHVWKVTKTTVVRRAVTPLGDITKNTGLWHSVVEIKNV